MYEETLELIIKLKKDFQIAAKHRDDEHYAFTYEMAIAKLKQIEEELRDTKQYGYWIRDDTDDYGRVICSVCKCTKYDITKCCPECGTKMKKGVQ